MFKKIGKEKRIVENDDLNVLMDCRPIRTAHSHLMVCVVYQSNGPSEQFLEQDCS